MTTLYKRTIQLAYQNPGPLKNALLPLLQKYASDKKGIWDDSSLRGETARKKKGGLFDNAFEGFDVPDYKETSEDIARLEAERLVGAIPRMQASQEVFQSHKSSVLVGEKYLYWPGKMSWYVYLDVPSSQAERIGKRLQRDLIGRRNLPASVPAVHNRTLYVGTNDGKVTVLPPLKRRQASEDLLLDRLPPDIVSRYRALSQEYLLHRLGRNQMSKFRQALAKRLLPVFDLAIAEAEEELDDLGWVPTQKDRLKWRSAPYAARRDLKTIVADSLHPRRVASRPGPHWNPWPQDKGGELQGEIEMLEFLVRHPNTFDLSPLALKQIQLLAKALRRGDRGQAKKMAEALGKEGFHVANPVWSFILDGIRTAAKSGG